MKYRVVYYIDSNSFGGAEQVLINIFKVIDRELWHPILAYHSYPGLESFKQIIEGMGIDTITIPTIQSTTDVPNILRFSFILRSIRPSIFHANLNWPLSCTGGVLSAYLAGINNIVATQHLYSELPSKRFEIAQLIVSLFIKRYIAISTDLANQLQDHILSADKIRVVRNGIDLDYYGQALDNKSKDYLSNLIGKPIKLPIVLTVARLDKQKGLVYLLKAASKFTDALFVFVGDGPERNHLEDQTYKMDLSDRVIFLGERNDIPNILGCCDLFVLPSIFEGGLALSIIEAMAAGKPVIATDISGVNKNVVNGDNIILVPPADPDALASAIELILTNHELANNIALSGRSLANKEFSAVRMVNELTGIYEQILWNRQGNQ